MKLIEKALADGSFLLDVQATDIHSVFHQVLHHVVARGLLPTEHQDDIERALYEREERISTAIGHAVAIPHTYLDVFNELVIVFVRLKKPLNLGAPDGVPTRFLFVLLGPPDRASEHLDTLMHIARLMSDEEFRYDAGEARTQQELLNAFQRYLIRSRPPEEEEAAAPTVGLEYTGRFFGGIGNDIARRLPFYIDDFRQGLHPKCVASVLFLFFACMASTVTFGGLLAELTDNQLGPVELILATAVCGVLYALFSGQPLLLLGGTGPLLAFTVTLYRMCGDFDIPFLPTYAWVGFWTGVFLVVLAAADASALMRYFTRFTDETFAALISVIFIYEAIKALVHIFTDHEVGYATALLSLLLAMGTYIIAVNLSRFRRSRYLLPWMREFLADFGPAIAIASMTAVAVALHQVELKELPAPDTFGTTMGRSWFVNPFDVSPWIAVAAIGPALFATVLLYLDQNITARLINSPDHNLQKGPGYHLDLALLGLFIGGCSLFGLPWVVAATVRSLNHLRSLATVEEVIDRSGQPHERVIHVRETRVTALGIHLLIGLSLFLLPLLKLIPMAVLYGVFLFMGVVSMAGNQFFERLSLWLMDSSLYPRTHYIRRVPMRTIHKYTMLQLLCLSALWIVKETPMGILFPLFLAILVPVRMLADRLFAAEHLAALDAAEVPEL